MAAAAGALLRATLGLADAPLRVAYLVHVIRSEPTRELALVLEHLCEKAEAMEQDAREFLVALVDAVTELTVVDTDDSMLRLREEAIGTGLLALERTLRVPIVVRARPSALPPGRVAREAVSPCERARGRGATKPPDYGFGRPITLGERKSLARKPSREMIERLLSDPHPEVIRRLLVSPKLVEDDLVRLAARRPGRPAVLAEIARSPKWIHRQRVRMAVLLNPDTPLPIAATLTSVLVRQELVLIVGTPHVPQAIRALCLERLQRRPPVRGGGTPVQ